MQLKQTQLPSLPFSPLFLLYFLREEGSISNRHPNMMVFNCQKENRVFGLVPIPAATGLLETEAQSEPRTLHPSDVSSARLDICSTD